MSDKNKAQKQKKEKDSITIFYMIKKIYPMCFRAKPSYFIFNQTISVFHGVSYGFSVLINQLFFDTAYQASRGEACVSAVFFMLVAFAGINIAQNILNAVHNFSHDVNGNRIWGKMFLTVSKKSAEIDPVEYENPARLDDINKAMNGIGACFHFMLTTSTLFTFYLPYFIFMAFYLYNLNRILIVSILCSFIPAMVSQLLRSSVFAKLEDESAPIRREFEAYSGAVCDKAFLKETRILGAFTYFKKLFNETIVSLNKAVWKANIKANLIEALLKLMSFLGYGGVLAMLVWLLLQGEITVGAFAAVYGSIGLLMYIMEEIINGHIGRISSNFGIIRNFLRFLEIPVPRREDAEVSKNGSIILENVSFRYPNAEHDSLKNINLAINDNETIAIVGENGAGKTTLVKIITGLYKPTQGSAKIDGNDMDKVSYRSLFKGVSGVSQKYQKYKMSLSDNIRISDFDYKGDVEAVLEKNGVEKDNRETFPNGLDTMLSREFDGVDISGGQWQRIAITRGFYRESDIIVLDEPTAAIDPIEESNIYKKFVEVSKGKTTVIVTHRMGSAKIAQKIIVMNAGCIEQIGSHEELMALDGMYKNMYEAQSVWYNG